MKIVFLGRKPQASRALRHLVDLGVDVPCVVAPQHPSESSTATFWRPLLRETARELGIPVVTLAQLRKAATSATSAKRLGIDLKEVDAVLSFLFWKKLPPEVIKLGRTACLNFHPGILPEFRRMRGYNHAILEGAPEYGATCHFVDESFDTGDIVEVTRFPISPSETALSLEQRTQAAMYQLFERIVALLRRGKPLKRVPQGKGQAASLEEMNALKAVRPDDPPDVIERKVRAFWYPPHEGAYIVLGGKKYTLVDPETLSLLGRYIHGSRSTPW
jgi:methionyl-tRNA formyltransferase